MSIPKVSIRQVKAARAMLGWSQSDLAERSGVSLPTLKRLESADGDLGGRSDTSDKILTALSEGGIVFDLAAGAGPGVRLKA